MAGAALLVSVGGGGDEVGGRPFVIAGLTSGSLYGLAAMGLVLTYKTSGIFNFAHGAIAAGAAYIFYELNTRNDVPWPIAGLMVICVVAPITGILTERIARGLADAPPSAKIVATVGLLLMCGLNKPSAGMVELFGEDVSRLSPPARAQRGLGRTFQRMELVDSLPVRDNVALGREAGMAGSKPWHHILTTKAERVAITDALDEAIELCGLAPLADRRAGAISTGQRRLVELARAIAGNFEILLKVEPEHHPPGPRETGRAAQGACSQRTGQAGKPGWVGVVPVPDDRV